MNEAQQLQQMQPLLYKQLQKSFEHGRLAHAYLFEGETRIWLMDGETCLLYEFSKSTAL